MVAGWSVAAGRVVGEGVGGTVPVGGVVVDEVEVEEGVIAAIDVPVQPREEEVFLGKARGRGGGLCHQEGDGVAALGGGDCGGALRGGDGRGAAGGAGGSLRERIRVGVERLAYAAESIVGEEVKEAVLDDWSADGSTKLLLLMHGLREEKTCDYGVGRVVQSHKFGVGVESVEGGIAQLVEKIPVNAVGSVFGDGVDLSAGGLAELYGVV